MEKVMDKGSKGLMASFEYLAKRWQRNAPCRCSVPLNLSVCLSPHRSLLHPPSLPAPPPPFPPCLHPRLLHPVTPYLDRSHDCCDTSWLTAHLHVLRFTSLLERWVEVEGQRYRVKGEVQPRELGIRGGERENLNLKTENPSSLHDRR